VNEHTAIEPGILYFGTPVVLISTTNEDGSVNLAPMSSAFWLGWRAVLGLGVRSRTAQNLSRTREGVLNLPSESLAAMEVVVEREHPVGDDGGVVAFEVRVQRVYVHSSIRVPGTEDRIDPDAWRPLIMSFQKFYGLGEQVHPSTLSRIPERLYRGPDIERARRVAS